MSTKNGKGRVTGNGTREQPWQPSAIELEVYAEYVKGRKTQKQVGEQFDRSQNYVGTIYRRINAWLWPIEMDRIREIKASHAQRLMHVYREAMEAWERSKMNETTVVTTTSKDVSTGETTRTASKGQVGNPAFLSEARTALLDIRKIWGADAPLEIRHTGEVRVAGRSREAAIQERIDRLTEVRENMLVPSEN